MNRTEVRGTGQNRGARMRKRQWEGQRESGIWGGGGVQYSVMGQVDKRVLAPESGS